MFNLSTSTSVGYNGISQLREVRCAPHLQVDSERRSAVPRALDDVYTFRDSDPPSIPAVKRTPPIKRPNGAVISSSAIIQNGIHEKAGDSNKSPARLAVRRHKDLFGEADGERCSENSIISFSSRMETVQIKEEPLGEASAVTLAAPSLSFSKLQLPAPQPALYRKLPSGKPPPRSSRAPHGRGPALHEALQRISDGAPGAPAPTWHAPATALFHCGALDPPPSPPPHMDCIGEQWSHRHTIGTRAERLAARRAALRRRATQLQYSDTAGSHGGEDSGEAATLRLLLAARGQPNLSDSERLRRRSGRLVAPVRCAVPGCGARSLACARLCLQHIASSPEQRLFTECTAKFSDNTQCRLPVVNLGRELPLCFEHAWKRDNYNKISQECKPKKAPRKRPKPSAMIRPQKRSRRRKRASRPSPGVRSFAAVARDSQEHQLCSTDTFLHQEDTAEVNVCSNSSGGDSSEDTAMEALSEAELMTGSGPTQHIDPEVVAQVLAMQETPLGLPSLSTVFSDFFAAEQNGEYIPSREETEELERALEAVNRDVKSLEKLTGEQHSPLLLDSLLDERTLAETLAALPDVFNQPAPS